MFGLTTLDMLPLAKKNKNLKSLSTGFKYKESLSERATDVSKAAQAVRHLEPLEPSAYSLCANEDPLDVT